MPVTGTGQVYQVEYQTVFTVDKQSAKEVEKEADSLLKGLSKQDSRYSSILNKLKELAGPQGAQGYTAAMQKAKAAAEAVDRQLGIIRNRNAKGWKLEEKTKQKLKRLQNELKVSLIEMSKVQTQITSKAKEEERIRANSPAAQIAAEQERLAKQALLVNDKNLQISRQQISIDKARASALTQQAVANDSIVQARKIQLSIDKESNSIAQQQARLNDTTLTAGRQQLALDKEQARLDKLSLLSNDASLLAKRKQLAITNAIHSENKKQAILNSTQVQTARRQTSEAAELLRIEARISLENNAQVQAAKTQLALAKAANAQARRQAAGGGQQNQGGGTGGNTSFAHKVSTTAQYSLAAAGLFAVANAAREGALAIIEFDTASRTLAAVINDLSVPAARALEDQLIGLGKAYGGSFEGINQAAVLLGRAGVAHEKLAKATEITIKLAKLTGDTLEVSSGSMVSYLEVFGKYGETVESLGDKLAYMANESRLSTQDIQTFSNYALAAADAAGLTVDAVSAVATQFSKAGVNASTIGTQIRSLTKTFLDGSKGVNKFFTELGVVQGNFQAELAAGGERSNAALVDLSKKLAGLTREEFNRITASMNILQRNSLALLRQQSEGIAGSIKTLTDGTHEGIKAADKILAGYAATWEKFKLTLVDVVVEFDNVLGASRGFFEGLERMTALVDGGAEAYADMWKAHQKLAESREYDDKIALVNQTLLTATNKIQIRSLIAVRAEHLKNQKALEDEAGIYKKRSKVLGEQDKLTSEQASAAKKRHIAIIDQSKAEIARLEKVKARVIALGKAQGKNKTGGRYTKSIASETAVIKASQAAIVTLNRSIKDLDDTKTAASDTPILGGSEVGHLKIAEQDIRNLVAASKEFFKDNALFDFAVDTKPLTQINQQIEAIGVRIKAIKDNNDSGGVLDIVGVDTTAMGLLQQSAVLQKEIIQRKEESKSLTGEELGAHNAVTRTIMKANELITEQIGLAKYKTELANVELTARDRILALEIARGQQLASQAGIEAQTNIDQNDKIAVAEQQYQTAISLHDVSRKVAETEKSTLQALKDKTAEEQARLNVIKVTDQVQLMQTKNFEKRAVAMQKEADAMTLMTGSSQEILAIEAERLAANEALGIEADKFKLTEEQKIKLIAQQNELYDRQLKQVSVNTKLMVGALDAFASSMSSALADSLEGMDSWADAAKAFRSALNKIIIELLVMGPIVDAIKSSMGDGASGSIGSAAGDFFVGLFSEKGNAFSGGSHLTKYAKGGVVSSPTLFPMTTGTGMMGEAGPEAIVPLTRTSGGDLGVKAQSPVVNVSVINNSSAEVTTAADEDGNIQFIIETVTNSIASGISRGTGPVGTSIQSTFGVSR